MELNIAKEYTDLPGGRYSYQGLHSGEDFRESLLRVKYDYCLSNNEKLIINLDGGYGYPSAFLEESFGGMVREGYNGKKMIKNMVFITNDEPSLEEKIIGYIKEAVKNQKNKNKKKYKR